MVLHDLAERFDGLVPLPFRQMDAHSFELRANRGIGLIHANRFGELPGQLDAELSLGFCESQ